MKEMHMKYKLMWSLWPGFLGACGLELFVFAALDPQQFRIFNTWDIVDTNWIYTLCFFIFWAACFWASFIALILADKNAMPLMQSD